MDEDRLLVLRNRLKKVYRHLSRQARGLGVSAYRVYDHDLPEFPFCIELYGENVYVAEYKRRHGMTEEEHDEWMGGSMNVISEVLAISKDNIFLKLRQRKPGRLGQYQKFGEVQHEFVVNENGLKFIVNLSDYLDTGLFLDHRITRQKILDEAKNKKVLNLFAYTGSFSVYAAAGAADEVMTVDLSRTYLDWAERNMQLNGFLDKKKYSFVQADVKQYLSSLTSDQFDLIIMDPPTFSNSKRMKDFLDIQQDHAELINQCMRLLKTGAVLYFSTNCRKFILNTNAILASSIKDITKSTIPFDFEGKLFRLCYYLKK